MNNQPALKISIPQPCTENWDEMRLDGCGRFCARCEKTVFDFSVLSDEQIGALLSSKRDRPLCGNFAAAQLDRLILIPEQPRSYGLTSRIAAALLFAVSGVTSFTVKAQNKAVMATVAGSDTAASANTGTIRIRGSIKDAAGNKPLMRMAIAIDGAGTQYSDRYGRFTFILPGSYAGRTLTITAKHHPLSSQQATLGIIPEETLHLEPGQTAYAVTLFRYPAETINLDQDKAITTAPVKTSYRGIYLPERVHRSRQGLWHRCKRIFKGKKNN